MFSDEPLDDLLLQVVRDSRPTARAWEDFADGAQALAVLEGVLTSGARSRVSSGPRWQPRLSWVAPTVAIAVVIAVVVIAAGLSSRNSRSAAPSRSVTTSRPGQVRPADPAAAWVLSLLRGTTQSGNTLGSATAPVTVTLYGDLESPLTAMFVRGPLASVIRTSVRRGRVRLAFSAVDTSSSLAGRRTFDQQQAAALAAGQQNQFWDYALLFLRRQGKGTGYLTAAFLDRLARELPSLDYAAWSSARRDSTLIAAVRAQQAVAHRARITATPTITVRGSHGSTRTLIAPQTARALDALIRTVARTQAR